MTHCPTCKKALTYADHAPSSPFCSERCRLIDFGTWMSDCYAIPSEEIILSSDDTHLTDEKKHQESI